MLYSARQEGRVRPYQRPILRPALRDFPAVADPAGLRDKGGVVMGAGVSRLVIDRHVRHWEALNWVETGLAAICQSDNPNFDRDRFIAACQPKEVGCA
jgi:hypothetical protein